MITPTIEKYGLTFKVTWDYDDDPDSATEYLGTYTDTWQPGAIDRKALGDMGRREVRYFVPGMSFRDHMRGWNKIWISERWARIEAAKYVMRDYKRMEQINNGNISIMICVVTAYLDGVKLDWASCGGFESDTNEEYQQEIINDLISEIIRNLDSTMRGDLRFADQRLARAKKLQEIIDQIEKDKSND